VTLLLVASTAAAEEPLRLADFGLKGQAAFKSFSHFSATPNDDQTFVDLALLQLEWSRRFAEWGAAKAIVEARDDDFGYARGLHFQIPETHPRRSYLSVKEATLAAHRGPLEVSVGKQIFAWGTADAFNPTDRLNPYDYLDPLDNEKLGVWSAAAGSACRASVSSSSPCRSSHRADYRSRTAAGRRRCRRRSWPSWTTRSGPSRTRAPRSTPRA